MTSKSVFFSLDKEKITKLIKHYISIEQSKVENNKVRTYNPSLKRRILYQLSYILKEDKGRKDSNRNNA